MCTAISARQKMDPVWQYKNVIASYVHWYFPSHPALVAKLFRGRMKMILVRHGETGWNRQRRIQGWLDSPLTPEAVAQLKRLFSDNPSLAHIR